MNFFVSPAERINTPLVTPADFQREVLASWPSARFEPLASPESPYAFDWQIDMAGGTVSGAYAKQGDTIVMEGDVFDCARIALWYRRLVPPRQLLIFYDEIYSASIELRAETPAEEIMRAFSQ